MDAVGNKSTGCIGSVQNENARREVWLSILLGGSTSREEGNVAPGVTADKVEEGVDSGKEAITHSDRTVNGGRQTKAREFTYNWTSSASSISSKPSCHSFNSCSWASFACAARSSARCL